MRHSLPFFLIRTEKGYPWTGILFLNLDHPARNLVSSISCRLGGKIIWSIMYDHCLTDDFTDIKSVC